MSSGCTGRMDPCRGYVELVALCGDYLNEPPLISKLSPSPCLSLSLFAFSLWVFVALGSLPAHGNVNGVWYPRLLCDPLTLLAAYTRFDRSIESNRLVCPGSDSCCVLEKGVVWLSNGCRLECRFEASGFWQLEKLGFLGFSSVSRVRCLRCEVGSGLFSVGVFARKILFFQAHEWM